jgi:molybdopterin-guanine dinucleotide biosynthesis protein A
MSAVVVEPARRNASAIILAGGKSSRMGRPKALLPFDHEPLIVHIVRTLKSMFAEAVVVAAPDQELPPLPATVVRDEVAYQGPVGGIYYGLKAAGGILFRDLLRCLFTNLSLISFLISNLKSRCRRFYWQERFQPACGLPKKRAAAAKGSRRGDCADFYDKVRT